MAWRQQRLARAIIIGTMGLICCGGELTAAECPAETPCTADDACSNQLVKVCASGPNIGTQCVSNADCSGSVCRRAWQEYYVDPGGDMSDCSTFRFGWAGADGVDLADPDGDGDKDIVTGWEESGVTYLYSNPCNPPDPKSPTSCTNPGAVYQEWAYPSAHDPADVRGGETTNFIEDAAFADFDLDGRPDGVITATEGLNKDVTVHARAHNGQWLGKALPGDSQLWMQVRAADINGDGCADIVAGTKVSIPGCVDDILEDPCALCDEFNVVCGRYGGVWWWECPKVDGVCQPFGPMFNDPDDPRMDLSRWNKRKIKRDLHWIMGIELTDMDGDGDNDVLVSDRLMIAWFENRTSPQQGGVLDGWGDPHVIDHISSVIGRGDGTRFSSGEPFRFHAYGDVDGDGLKDIVVAANFSKGTCSGDSCLYCSTFSDCPNGQTCEDSGSADAGRFAGYYYRRTSADGQYWTVWPIYAEGGLPYGIDIEGDAVSKGVAIGDVTGDGHKDLVFSVRGAGHALYSLSFDPSANQVCAPCATAEWKVRPISPCRTGSKYDNVQLADIDADGRLDVVTTEENFQADRGEAGPSTGLGVVWYRNLGFCGNGHVEADEECDNGPLNGTLGQCCDISCRIPLHQICRASTSVCDAEEICQAGSGSCPADGNKPAGTPCAVSACDAISRACTADGVCEIVPSGIPCTQSIECATGVCILNFCAAACTDDGNPCTYDVCNGGVCQHPPKPPATICGDDGNECTVQRCNGAGVCQVFFLGTQTNCGEIPTQSCDALDFCDGAGNCTKNVRSAGSTCRPSARGQSQSFCDPPETCDGVHQECPPDLTAQVGAVCADPPPRTCDADESICYGYCSEYQCDASHFCALTGIAPGAVCYDDANECTVHTCIVTWCIRQSVGSGEPCTDDGNECTLDVCNGIECAHWADPSIEICDEDGNHCTDDICADGQCAHVPVPGRACADDGDVCTENVCGENGNCYPPAPDETPCPDDGSVCTNDSCLGGVCTHSPVQTQTACESDNNECTDDVCITGKCKHVVLVGQLCTDDGNECTTDACNERGHCSHPPAPDATPCTDDGNICTKDACGSGVCVHPPEAPGFACGNPSTSECDAPDGCDGAGACAPNHAPNQTACTPDALDCTVDECRQGLCVHAAELPLPTGKGVEPLCGGHALLPVSSSPNDVIRAFAIFDDGNGPALYAGGTMLHKWDGKTWTQIHIPIAGTILAMEVADLLDFGDAPALYIGGTLAAPLDGPQPLRRWDGQTWTDLGPFNGPVHALEAAWGALFAGGAFTTVDFTLGNGTPVNLVVNHVARIRFLDPPIWEALGVGTDGAIHALSWGLYSSSPFDRLGVGGAFTIAGGFPASGFAYWDLNSLDGGWTTVDPLLPPEGGGLPVVYTIASYGLNDYLRPFNVGGLFRVPDVASPTGFSNNVASLFGIQDDWYGTYAAGAGVTSASDHAVRSIAPAVDQSGEALFIGGEFGSFNDVTAPQIVRISGDTHTLGSCLNGAVEAMISFDDGTGEALYVGGLFTNADQEHFVARWHALRGDLDGSGIVTPADFTAENETSRGGLLWCLAGPEPWRAVSGVCACADLNGDGLVDLLREVFAGQGSTDPS